MRETQLHRLAEQAGVQVQWRNFRGDQQEVAPEVLRAVLQALQYDVSDERSCDRALAEMAADERERLPALIVGTAGRSLTLPRALNGSATGDQGWLWPEDEKSEPLPVAIDTDGELARCRALPDQPGYYRLELAGKSVRLALAPQRCTSVADLTGKSRAWGAAAQLYSLRRADPDVHGCDGGIGDFAALAALARELGGFGADALAISPVHALFSADVNHFSPYSPSSRLFLSPLHIDVGAALAEAGLSLREVAPELEAELGRLKDAALVDWPAAARARLQLLRAAWNRQADDLLQGRGQRARQFQAWREARGVALENHARFEAIHAWQFGRDPGLWHWRQWEPAWRDPGSPAVADFAAKNPSEIGYHAYLQWLSERGLDAAQQTARDAGMGIGLVADLAVGTDTGGSHAWSFQDEMLIGLSVGAPPDLLNAHGQNWGLTTFSPRGLQRHGYQPFIDMLRACLRQARGLRIDHILGLCRLWVIPEGFEDGAYLSYPVDDLLKLIALESWRHGAVICGEDLGTVPEGLRESLSDEGIMGMRVLWFEQDHGLFVEPACWSDQAMAVTTTHDLPTVAGWWCGRDIDWRVKLGLLGPDSDEATERAHRAHERRVLWSAFEHAGVAQGPAPAPDETDVAVAAAIEFVGKTRAPLTIVPLEDVLGLIEQPNLPGTTDQHPNWCRRLPAPAPGLLGTPDARRRIEALQRGRARS